MPKQKCRANRKARRRRDRKHVQHVMAKVFPSRLALRHGVSLDDYCFRITRWRTFMRRGRRGIDLIAYTIRMRRKLNWKIMFPAPVDLCTAHDRMIAASIESLGLPNP